MASHDVIEHVYDVDAFLRTMSLLSDQPFKMIHASGANSHNPLLALRFKRLQREFEGERGKTGRPSYFDARRKIIAAAADLSDMEIDRLARQTRGLRREDIEACVERYLDCGDTAYRPGHATNTCDPETGNWVEQLLSTRRLERTLREQNFDVEILAGYWSSTGMLASVKRGINVMLRLLGRKSLWMAPYYIVLASRSSYQAWAPAGRESFATSKAGHRIIET